MELSLREWIMVASFAVVAAIVGHAMWLRWRSRRNRLRIEIDPGVAQTSGVDDLDLLRGELPNGGARVVDGVRVPASKRADVGTSDREGAVAAPGRPLTAGDRSGRNVPEAGKAASAGDSPPVLLDPVAGGRRVEPEIGFEVRAGRHDEDLADIEPDTAAGHDARTAQAVEDSRAAARSPPRATQDRPAPGAQSRSASGPGSSGQSRPADAPQAPSAAEKTSTAQTASTAEKTSAAQTTSAAQGDRTADDAEEEELIVMQVLARDREGFEIGALTTRATGAGMIFGDFNIFHRYKDGRAQRQFIEYSMANAVEPGVFDLADGGSRTKGVAFFMQLPVPSEPMDVFEDMVRVASDIANALGGELRDERHSVITPQTIEHCRERVREFNRRQQIRG